MAKRVLTILFALIMIAAGLVHFARPEKFLALVPAPLPGLSLIYASGLAELLVGIATLVPRTRFWGTLGIAILMIAYLPLHMIDAVSEHPAVGSHAVALVRLPLQFVLIAWAFYIHRWSQPPAS